MNALTPIELSFGSLTVSCCGDMGQMPRLGQRSVRSAPTFSGHVKHDA